MKKVLTSSSSSSSSPPLLQTNNSTSSEVRSGGAAVIPLDYSYQTMAPSSDRCLQTPFSNTSSTRLNENVQYSSLFGDPIPPPPPEDFFLSQFPDAIHFSRRPSMIRLSSDDQEEENGEEEDGNGEKGFAKSRTNGYHRLFSETPFISNTRRISDAIFKPLLQPPDIQILPNSSGGSSSELAESPNSALLASDDIFRHPGLYERSVPIDSAGRSQIITPSNVNRDHLEHLNITRRVSNISEDFKSNVGSLGSNPEIPDLPTKYTHQLSIDSYSSSEWFHPSIQGISIARSEFPEFSKMPCLRPSSKNVMSMKQDEMPMHHSPVAAMINDSSGSNSGEERLMSSTVVLDRPSVFTCSPTPTSQRPNTSQSSVNYLPETEMGLLLSPHHLFSPRHKQGRDSSDSDSVELNFPLPPAPPLPAVSPSHTLQQTPILPDINEGPEVLAETGSFGKDRANISPVVLKEAVAIGQNFRIDQARLHKKTAFTIISGTTPTPQASRAQTPVSVHQKSLISPFLGFGFKDVNASSKLTELASPKRQIPSTRKSLSATELKLPHIKLRLNESGENSSMRPSVQFYMADRPTPSKVPQKGILQHHKPAPGPPTTQDENIGFKSNLQKPPNDSVHASSPYALKMKSCEALPLITDPYRTSLPRINRSSIDIRREPAAIPPGALPRPIHPNPNPTRKHPGLLRIINSADSLSRIPLRSNWSSMDDLVTMQNNRRSSLCPSGSQIKARRRSSSTSPERRSSTQTMSDRRSSNLSTVTTSDFSFRRPSITAKLQEKQIIANRKPATRRRQGAQGNFKVPLGTELNSLRGIRMPRNRIAKPTTLSPIIGTPNKESSTPQSIPPDSKFSSSKVASGNASRRGSLSKIPVRNESDSMSNSRMSSRSGSRRESRSTSPMKDSAGMQPYFSGLTSRTASSRSLSRDATVTESQASSRANSRTPSRSTSRASSRPVARGPSSRPNSRTEETNQLTRKIYPQNATKISLAAQRIKTISSHKERKSISLSPLPNSRGSALRRNSLSPHMAKNKSALRKSKGGERRNSRSMIPTRTTNSAKQSPDRNPKRSSLTRKSFRSKEISSAKNMSSSVQKPVSNIKSTPSATTKRPTVPKKQSQLQRNKIGTTLQANPLHQGTNLGQKEENRGTSDNAKSAEKSLKNEATALSLKKTGPSSDNKRLSTGIGAVTSAAKVSATKTAALAGSKTVGGNTSQSTISKGTPNSKTYQSGGSEIKTASDTDLGSAQSDGKLRKQDTKLRLIRAGSKLSLLSRKRSDTSLIKKLDTETVSITEESNGSVKAAHSQLSTSSGENLSSAPAATLEQSQKILENVQKTVTEATNELEKTINGNLTDPKSFESDMSRGLSGYDSAASSTSSVATVVENKGAAQPAGPASESRTGTSESVAASGVASMTKILQNDLEKSPVPPSQPIEAAVSVINGAVATASAVLSAGTAPNQPPSNLKSWNNDQNGVAGTDRVSDRAICVLPEVDCESENFQNYELDIDGGKTEAIANDDDASKNNGARKEFKIDTKRRSPDGQGGSVAGSDDNGISSEYLDEKTTAEKDSDDNSKRGGCYKCCAQLCMPCRRSYCSRCCSRNSHPPCNSSKNNNNNDDDVQTICYPTPTKCEVINEKKPKFWKTCCKRKKKAKLEQQKAIEEYTELTDSSGRCGLCLNKILCCQSVNKVKATTTSRISRPDQDETEPRKCCFCIPCGRRRRRSTDVVSSDRGSAAWQDPESDIPTAISEYAETSPQPTTVLTEKSCCKRFCGFLVCCRRKTITVGVGLQAAPAPEHAEARRKLHADLVEYNSKMKGAIPVLPLYLAWFCAVCNVVIPGLGTVFSGLFCICLGIPRFSHYDSAKARFGAFIINTIVGIAQFFCVLFCCVGWGWSIWWGTIMLKCAKKLNKIKKVERLEKEEEQRQMDQIAASTAVTIPGLASEVEGARQ